jgi:sec-independent protein translocase protein TatA
MYHPGPFEIIVILVLVLLLFGKRLPEVARNLGRGMVEFKKGLRANDDEAPGDPASDPHRGATIPPALSAGEQRGSPASPSDASSREGT